MHTDMAVSRITMKSLAKFGFCLTILLTSVAGEWLISALILWGMGGGGRECAPREYLMRFFFFFILGFLLSVMRPLIQFGADVVLLE